MPVREPVNTSFIEEDDVLDQETEERNDNLKEGPWHSRVTKIGLKEVLLVARQEPKQSRQCFQTNKSRDRVQSCEHIRSCLVFEDERQTDNYKMA